MQTGTNKCAISRSGFLRAWVLDSPTRSQTWKTCLSAVPVCAAVGGLSRIPHGVIVTEIAAAVLAGAGASLAILSMWHERKYKALRKELAETHSKFMLAAETSLDAFCLLDAVRDSDGKLIDFQIRYLNKNAEHLLGKSRVDLMGHRLCERIPTVHTSGRFQRYCEVVETGIPMDQEYPVTEPHPLQSTWMRYQAVKLGDGLAVTCSDISSIKETQIRYEYLVEFNESASL